MKGTWKIIIMITGASAGSFINSLAQGTAFNRRSRCDYCGKMLCFFDMVPVFSYLFHKGRSRCCGKRLSPIYPFGEVSCAVGALVAFEFAEGGLKTAGLLLLLAVICYASTVDILKMIIPDICHVLIIMIRLTIFADNRSALMSLAASAVFIIYIITIVTVTNIVRDSECMGFGDIKLFFSLSLFVSLLGNMYALLLAAISALVFILLSGSTDRPIPFGPFICLAYYVIIVFKIGG